MTREHAALLRPPFEWQKPRHAAFEGLFTQQTPDGLMAIRNGQSIRGE